MAIPVNELKNWDNGTPFGGIQGQENTDNILGELKYWDNGTPYVYVFPNQASGGGGSLIKTINGLAIASVKTINGLPIASVKSWNGLTNV